MGTYTTNKTMYKPAFKEVQYQSLINANFDIIDAGALWLEFSNAKTCGVAEGASFIRFSGLQVDSVAMTGTLRGAYIDVSNGSTAATGTIRAMELKARTEAPDDTGNDVNVLEGLSISADSKAHDVTIMRAAEFILDGKTSGTIGEMVGLRLANNLQVDKATTAYALQIYADSFNYDWGIYAPGCDKHYFTGNIGMGTTSFGTSAATNLVIANGTAPSASVADTTALWSADVNAAAGYSWLHGRDEKGHTLIVAGIVIKTDTGNPADPHEGLIEINTFDNKVNIYADAGWREMATW